MEIQLFVEVDFVGGITAIGSVAEPSMSWSYLEHNQRKLRHVNQGSIRTLFNRLTAPSFFPKPFLNSYYFSKELISSVVMIPNRWSV